MNHINPHSRPAAGSLNLTLFSFCRPDPAIATDGNCIGLYNEDGVLVFAISGGWIPSTVIPLSKG